MGRLFSFTSTRYKFFAFLLPGLVMLALSFLPLPDGSLAYDRAAIAQGEIWRLLTGNFVHFTQYHSFMNALGLSACSVFLFATQPLARWLLCFLFVLAGVGVGLWLLNPELDEYRGMSGAVYGMLAAGLILNLRQNRLMHSLILLALTAKIVFEQLPSFDPNYMLAQIGVPVAADAHLYGALTGALFAASVTGLGVLKRAK